MPTIQPWVTLYDDNDDGLPESSMVKYVAPGMGFFYAYSRFPTDKEIEWFMRN